MQVFPVRVLSIESWFRREFPEFPWNRVHLNEGLGVDQRGLNPYEAALIIVYVQQGRLSEIKGFLHYGGEELGESLPPLPAAQPPVRVEASLQQTSLESISTYIFHYVNPSAERPIPTQHVGFDLLILMLGRYSWHKVQASIPLEALRAFGIRLPPAIQPHLKDLQWWWPRAFEEWFEVPLEALPNTLSRQMPLLWHGGKMHVPDAEVWQTLFYPPIARPLSGQLRFIEACIADAEREKRTRRYVSALHHEDYSTKEQALHHAAPCMKAILDRKRFPRDQERQYLVRIWARARVPESVVEEILREKNDRYPHASGCITLKRRWDYSAHYEKGYAPPYCDRMESYCPFQGSLDQKKSACYLQFINMFPEKKTPRASSFKGPVNWYEW